MINERPIVHGAADLVDGEVDDVYMPDMKYWTDE